MKKLTLNELVVNALICALYVVLTLVNPLSYGAVQFRFSEFLSVIPFFNRKYIPSITVGVFLANMYSEFGLIDVFVGVLICVISYTISYYLKNVYINASIYAILCGILVGAEISILSNIPFLATALAVFAGQIVVNLFGAVVFKRIKEKTTLLD
ncbi:QueT transporter family protein [Peptostreptococcus faecalis]|uniref:QueT transporter family protein n=1 Tax=Peptostreptococcus faecalis TaxID=2045015 RepID=UPI000C7B572C|nr:QueT transporter family protein [Peptostreptococcus faecalis]